MKLNSKSLKLKNFAKDFHYQYIDKNETSTIVIVTGWPSMKEIFREVIKSVNANVIIFDYVGVGDNSHFKANDLKSSKKSPFQIHEDFINEIIDEYDITAVLGTSAGSVFLINRFKKLHGVNTFFILSPQWSITIVDRLLGFLFRFVVFIQNFPSMHSLFKKMMNSKIVVRIWTAVVAKNSKNSDTKKYVIEGLRKINSEISPITYFDLLAEKKISTEMLRVFLNAKKVVLFYGTQDNLLNIKEMMQKLEDSSEEVDDIITSIPANHVLELEAPEKIARIINDSLSN